jgi:hypothetical protein
MPAALTPELLAWVEAYETEERKLNEQEQNIMGRHAKDTGGGDFTPAPAGTHVARCIKLIDIGTHHGEYQGTPNVRNQVIVQWELPNETMEIEGEQKPFVVSQFYTNSLSEKANMRKDLEAWRGKQFATDELMGFDLMNILGKPCMLTVLHEIKDGKTKGKVSGVTAMPKGMQCPAQVNESFSFWIDEWNDNKFAALSEGFKRLVMESDEYKEAFTPPGQRAAVKEAAKQTEDDDIPFS